MRALITGVSGFVGSHLVDYLLARTDWNITGMMRWGDPLTNLHGFAKRINNKDRIELVYADLNDPFSLNQAVKSSVPDYVFHLAAQSFPKTSFSAPSETLQTNVIGTLNLLESLKGTDCWIHLCSSSEVYGQVKKENVPIKEECPLHPASPYAISKAGSDMLGQFYAEAYGMKVVRTRMFTHTGARRGDVFFESSFAKQIAMIEAGLLEPPVMVGNLDSLRTIADVRDAVRAYHMLLTENPIAGEVYNIGGAHVCTVGEFLEALFVSAGVRYPVRQDPERMRPLDADLQVPDCSKFNRHTGWEPEISFEQTVNSLLEYWRQMVKKGIPLQR